VVLSGNGFACPATPVDGFVPVGESAGGILGVADWMPRTRRNLGVCFVGAFGDLYPVGQLRWKQAVNNYKACLTGDIPVGRKSELRIFSGAAAGGA
jgi:hypothetical protein